MSLKNFTKVDIPDWIANEVRHRVSLLDEPRRHCLRCGKPPTWGYDSKHYSGVCWKCSEACEHDNEIIGYIIKANGSQQCMSKCMDCGKVDIGIRRGSRYLDICFKDHRNGLVCERCGDTEGVELHHYAPRNMFDDYHKWATGHLCPACHRLWHTTMDGYRWRARRNLTTATTSTEDIA